MVVVPAGDIDVVGVIDVVGFAVLDISLVLITSKTNPPVLPHPNARAPLSTQLYVLQSEKPGSELKYR